jgi:hypothetical protein
MRPELPQEIVRLFRAKQARRRELARLPFEEKMRIVFQLQRTADDILTMRGRPERRRKIGSAPRPRALSLNPFKK